MHHIIPINAQEDFPNVNIDIPENVVCLCPSCHREIHNGRDSKEMMIKLFDSRKDILIAKGISLNIEKMCEYYGIDKNEK